MEERKLKSPITIIWMYSLLFQNKPCCVFFPIFPNLKDKKLRTNKFFLMW